MVVPFIATSSRLSTASLLRELQKMAMSPILRDVGADGPTALTIPLTINAKYFRFYTISIFVKKIC
jgi:hypothetical protein